MAVTPFYVKDKSVFSYVTMTVMGRKTTTISFAWNKTFRYNHFFFEIPMDGKSTGKK
jgi:hypothetical protein